MFFIIPQTALPLQPQASPLAAISLFPRKLNRSFFLSPQYTLTKTFFGGRPVNIKKDSLLPGVRLLMTALLLFLTYHLARQAAMLTSDASAPAALLSSPVVVVDSGHGGRLYRRKCGKCRWGPDSDSGGDSYSGNSWNTLLENSVSRSI